MKLVYTFENLDCAHCAGVIESKIQKMPEVESASLTFVTKQLTVEAKNEKGMLEKIQSVADSVEDGVIFKKKEEVKTKKLTYTFENLDCAHCAGVIENKIKEMPEIESASLTFVTKQLTVETKNEYGLLKKIQGIADSVEDGVVFKEKEDTKVVKKTLFQEKKAEIISLIAGAVLFIAGFVSRGYVPIAGNILFTAAYLIFGFKVLKTAVVNITKGQVFDENFLMSIATIAAFALGDFAEAAGVMLFYRVGEFFEDVAVEKSRSQIMDAVDMRPESVHVVKGDEIIEVGAKEAKPGDIILIRPGDRIPLDGKVVEGESRLDTSPVTGESVPVSVLPGDEILSGCVNEGGVLRVEVTRALENSMVTRILNSVENAAATKPKLDRFISRFAKVYTPIVVLIAVATAIIPSLITGDWNKWIYTAVTFLVISCPCALVLSVPLAYFAGIGAASKRGILFKGGAAIEGLEKIKAVTMDKTGTLTKGTFTIKEIKAFSGLTNKQILTMAAGAESASTHPIANSIVRAARAEGYETVTPSQVQEIRGKGIKALFSEGELLCGNRKLMEDAGVELEETPQNPGGATIVYVALDHRLAGWILIDDTIKEDAKKSIQKMNQLKLHTSILTGDEKTSALAVGEQVGVQDVYGKLLPDEKLERLRGLRKEYGPVLFVGDGINDAPVLAGADVGAAMGSGADAAIEAADVVFMNNQVGAILNSIKISKSTGKIAIQNVVFALAIKAIVMILGFMGFANMWLAVFADTGVALLCVLNSVRILYRKKF
ncbi:Cd2+/Zn2+-exporting ATPase [Aequitasia blattaphilus]|uniref:Cd(2+)-exporting ATPase n=1 Tax=Aequitasia blattaphilus TaxID=2949332 RepID=A0ABT1E9V9_9FIRM|nr:heavy metal translocating P-type ATPase [Aequitasia blattaphilus]MCP1102616.1 heavy metal translocating P-type ATPase [Aequitasia blattaphilus]MCR8615256.1 heavy metal translocating P-type ATPase [Aequitasia blattaphilus]